MGICAVLALGTAGALAQANPAARGSNTTPRFATQARAPLQVTQSVASGLSPYPDVCGDTTGTVYVGAEVEPHVAVNPMNPNNLIGVWQQDRYSNGASRGLVTGVSMDGGATWTRRVLPFTACAGSEYLRGTDPWVSFAPDGTAHQVVLGLSGGEFTGVGAVIASRSTDGGLTWSPGFELIHDGAGFFNDKETITADPTDARFVYAAWDRLRAGADGPAMFARSTDAGVTWEPARAIYTPGGTDQTIGNLIRVLPNGTLVDVTTIIRASVPTINVLRSTDRGATWSGPTFVANLGANGTRDPVSGAPVRDGSIIPQMAAGPDGTLHIVWQDARFTQLRDAIAYSRSTDGGATWSTPVRVNFNPNVAAFTPQVHVRDDGMVGVTYYDFRSDTASPTTLLTDFWLARSSDGVTWTETRVSNAFDLTLAPVAGGYFLGDYTGLASAGATFIAFFGRTNATTANRTDIVAARIAPGGTVTASFGAKRSERVAPPGAPYRAQELPTEDPGTEFWDAVAANAERALEARRRGRAPPSDPPPMR